MKAAFYGGGRFSVEEAPEPLPGPGEVAVRVAFCGICGTDLHIYRGHMDARVGTRRVIGHEMAGTVAAAGAGVESIAPGLPVVVRPLISCGACPACEAGHPHICHRLNFVGIDSDGAFRETMVVPAALLHAVPGDLPLLHAALVEPTAVACHALRRSRLEPGEVAVVLGGGPIGVLVAMVARHAGAEVVIAEPNPLRRAVAEGLGFAVVAPEAAEAHVGALSQGRGADVVFEVSGSAGAARAMTALTAVRGRVVMVAIHPEPVAVDLFRFFWRELEMIGARVYEPEDFDAGLTLLQTGAIPAADLITDILPLDGIAEAFAGLEGNAQAMKRMIRIGGQPA